MRRIQDKRLQCDSFLRAGDLLHIDVAMLELHGYPMIPVPISFSAIDSVAGGRVTVIALYLPAHTR